jgi:hypothetical protein
MALDPAVMIGWRLPARTVTVDGDRVRFFRKAIGAEPIDEEVVPPTFLFSLELDIADPFAWLRDLSVDLRRVLHGGQSFIYHRPARPGDVLTASPQITDVYSKNDGALDFIIKETIVTGAGGERVADLTSTIIVRNPKS